jgi:hypothetical protein
MFGSFVMSTLNHLPDFLVFNFNLNFESNFINRGFEIMFKYVCRNNIIQITMLLE